MFARITDRVSSFAHRYIVLSGGISVGPAAVFVGFDGRELFSRPFIEHGVTEMLAYARIHGLGLNAEVHYDRAVVSE
jgi:hypothetical protein